MGPPHTPVRQVYPERVKGAAAGNIADHDELLMPIWAFVAIPLLFSFQRFAQALLAPSKVMGVFYIIIFKILSHDITPFMIIFGIFLLNYGLAMYITAPPYLMDDTSDNNEGRWTLTYMIQDLVKLGLLVR